MDSSLFYAQYTTTIVEVEVNMMILFLILLLMLVILAIIVVLAVSVGGAAFILVFGDVIVCMVLIGLILKHLFKRRK